jgi:hypothetical protein
MLDRADGHTVNGRLDAFRYTRKHHQLLGAPATRALITPKGFHQAVRIGRGRARLCNDVSTGDVGLRIRFLLVQASRAHLASRVVGHLFRAWQHLNRARGITQQ